MNAAVGIATALVMWLTGVGDPILWGAVAFLLNFVPILGPVLGVVIFLLAGLLTNDTLWQALLPAGLYLGIHLIEGETITPMLLAKRFILNPVLVIISLVFWFWMWGVPGAFFPCPCWRSLKSSVTAFGRWPHLDTFWRDDYVLPSSITRAEPFQRSLSVPHPRGVQIGHRSGGPLFLLRSSKCLLAAYAAANVYLPPTQQQMSTCRAVYP